MQPLELLVLDLDRLPPGALLPATLPPDEHARYLRFHRQADRDRFLAGRMLARAALARRLGCEAAEIVFALSPAGQPAATHPAAPPFSIAHSGCLVVLALGAGRVGVDVEAGARLIDPLALAAGVMTPAERRDIAQEQDPAARLILFLRLWTLKEAYTKALGQGLLLDPRGIGFALDGPARLDPPNPGWRFAEYTPLPGYPMALAWQGDAPPPAPADAAPLLRP